MADETWVPQFLVKIGGVELPADLAAHLQNVTIDLRRQAPASCEAQFNNHEGTFDGRADLGPGTKIEVHLGYTKNQALPLTRVFEGEIVGTQVRAQENGPRSYSIRAFDAAHKLTRGRNTRTFLNQKFSEIVQSVGQQAGLTVEAQSTNFQREYVVQNNQTDLDFARGIATWLDFDLCINHLVNPSALLFNPANAAGDPEVTAIYNNPNPTAGEVPLRRFDGRQSLARVVSEVVVRGWDPQKKQEIIGRAVQGAIASTMAGQSNAAQEVVQAWGETDRQLVDYKVFSVEEAEAIATAKINEYARTFIRADVEVQGHPKLRAGGIVKLGSVGERFDGHYLVEQVTHVFTSAVGPRSGYTTRFVGERCGW